MGHKGRVDKATQKVIASSRVHKLFVMAEKSALSNKLDLATRYVDIARRISMKYQMPIPKELEKVHNKWEDIICEHLADRLMEWAKKNRSEL